MCEREGGSVRERDSVCVRGTGGVFDRGIVCI